MTITQIIKRYMKQNDITQTWLAEKMNENKQNISYRLSRNSMEVDYLRRLCELLKHDFFSDYSKEMRKEVKENFDDTAISTIGNYIPKSEYDKIVKENLDLHRELRQLYKEYREAEKRSSSLKK